MLGADRGATYAFSRPWHSEQSGIRDEAADDERARVAGKQDGLMDANDVMRALIQGSGDVIQREMRSRMPLLTNGVRARVRIARDCAVTARRRTV